MIPENLINNIDPEEDPTKRSTQITGVPGQIPQNLSVQQYNDMLKMQQISGASGLMQKEQSSGYANVASDIVSRKYQPLTVGDMSVNSTKKPKEEKKPEEEKKP
jgi:hypothetical protein